MKISRWVWWGIAAAGVLLTGNRALAQYGGGYGGWGMGPGMMWNGPMGWMGMPFMIVFWILLIVGLVFLVKWLITSSRGDRYSSSGGSRALDILRERYARGEINKEEFDRMRRDLSS